MFAFLWNVLLLSIAIFLVARFLPGIRIKNYATAFLVSLVYSLIDALVFQALVFLSFPLVFLTLGLFIFIINAFLLWLTDKLIEDFEISSFGMTILASILISIINGVLRFLFF